VTGQTDERDGRREAATVTSIARNVGTSRVDRAIAPYFREPALWPVTIVLLAHGVLGVGVALLEALRSGMGFSLVSLVLLLVLTVWSLARDLRIRRCGVTSASLIVCWSFGALTAWAADHYGLY
jgi:hypothetical protein